MLDAFLVGFDRLHAQTQRGRDLSPTESRTEQLENVDFPIRQVFNTSSGSWHVIIFRSPLQRFPIRTQGYLPADVNATPRNIADSATSSSLGAFFIT